MERERKRLQTNLVGHEDRHLVNIREDAREMESDRWLRGRSINRPIPTPPVPPVTHPSFDPTQAFDPGIGQKPPLPKYPPPHIPQLGVMRDGSSEPPPLNQKVKPSIPPKPGQSIPQDNQGGQVVSSEMESDDYHHISEQLNRAAEKINKVRLIHNLQDREKPPSRLSESDEEAEFERPTHYTYDDGEVALKVALPPQSPSESEGITVEVGQTPKESPERFNLSPTGQYLSPRQLPAKSSERKQKLDYAKRREEAEKIEAVVKQWTGSGTKSDGRYYSYNSTEVESGQPIEKAIIYHPPARTFVRIEGNEVSKVARMPITKDQLIIFQRFPCFTCYDPLIESSLKGDVLWDSLQTEYSDADPNYETPHQPMTSNGPTSDFKQRESKVNSFGNSVELDRDREPPRREDVDHLLDLKNKLRDQLRDLSSESNEDEWSLP